MAAASQWCVGQPHRLRLRVGPRRRSERSDEHCGEPAVNPMPTWIRGPSAYVQQQQIPPGYPLYPRRLCHSDQRVHVRAQLACWCEGPYNGPACLGEWPRHRLREAVVSGQNLWVPSRSREDSSRLPASPFRPGGRSNQCRSTAGRRLASLRPLGGTSGGYPGVNYSPPPSFVIAGC